MNQLAQWMNQNGIGQEALAVLKQMMGGAAAGPAVALPEGGGEGGALRPGSGEGAAVGASKQHAGKGGKGAAGPGAAGAAGAAATTPSQQQQQQQARAGTSSRGANAALFDEDEDDVDLSSEGDEDDEDDEGGSKKNNRVGGGAGKRLRYEDLQAQFGKGLKVRVRWGGVQCLGCASGIAICQYAVRCMPVLCACLVRCVFVLPLHPPHAAIFSRRRRPQTLASVRPR